MSLRCFVIFVQLILLPTACANEGTGTGEKADVIKLNDYSEHFVIEQFEGYSKLTVKNPWQGAKNKNFIYFIGKDRSMMPRDTDESNIIISPVKSIICTSTTHISMIDTLGGIEFIRAVSGSDYVYNRKIQRMISADKIVDIGYESGYNTELIYSLNPDVVLVYGVGSESAPAFTRLKNMGVPVLYIADYLEQHPLARAEWIKVYGELLRKRDEAQKIFRGLRDDYTSLARMIKNSERGREVVMLGLPFKDKWFVSPGNSYISKLIEDAGGQYLWSDRKSDISIPMSLEAVCREGIKADIWLNTGTAGSLDDILSVDSRLAELPILSGEARVYNNNRRLNRMGGNDYWESGTLNPHIILKDMASIINPELFPNHELYYYNRLQISKDTLKQE